MNSPLDKMIVNNNINSMVDRRVMTLHENAHLMYDLLKLIVEKQQCTNNAKLSIDNLINYIDNQSK